MAADKDSGSRFTRVLIFRRRGTRTQVLRVLEDADGWFYVVNLAGTPDFGPYLKDELTSVFEVEADFAAARDLDPRAAEGLS